MQTKEANPHSNHKAWIGCSESNCAFSIKGNAFFLILTIRNIKALGQLTNLYEASHYLNEILYLFFYQL